MTAERILLVCVVLFTSSSLSLSSFTLCPLEEVPPITQHGSIFLPLSKKVMSLGGEKKDGFEGMMTSVDGSGITTTFTIDYAPLLDGEERKLDLESLKNQFPNSYYGFDLVGETEKVAIAVVFGGRTVGPSSTWVSSLFDRSSSSRYRFAENDVWFVFKSFKDQFRTTRVACEGTAPSPRIGHSFNRDPRNHFSSTSSSSHHRFFVFGGFDGLRYCNDMFQLDVWINKQDQTTSNFWESIGIDSISCKWSEVSMKSDSTGLITWPDARAYFDSATFENAREREGASLLISGGSNSRGVFHSMFKFDLDQYLWKRVPLCTTPNAQPLSFSKTKYLEERQSHKMEVLGSFRLYHSEECTNDGSFFTSTFDGAVNFIKDLPKYWDVEAGTSPGASSQPNVVHQPPSASSHSSCHQANGRGGDGIQEGERDVVCEGIPLVIAGGTAYDKGDKNMTVFVLWSCYESVQGNDGKRKEEILCYEIIDSEFGELHTDEHAPSTGFTLTSLGNLEECNSDLLLIGGVRGEKVGQVPWKISIDMCQVVRKVNRQLTSHSKRECLTLRSYQSRRPFIPLPDPLPSPPSSPISSPPFATSPSPPSPPPPSPPSPSTPSPPSPPSPSPPTLPASPSLLYKLPISKDNFLLSIDHLHLISQSIHSQREKLKQECSPLLNKLFDPSTISSTISFTTPTTSNQEEEAFIPKINAIREIESIEDILESTDSLIRFSQVISKFLTKFESYVDLSGNMISRGRELRGVAEREKKVEEREREVVEVGGELAQKLEKDLEKLDQFMEEFTDFKNFALKLVSKEEEFSKNKQQKEQQLSLLFPIQKIDSLENSLSLLSTEKKTLLASINKKNLEIQHLERKKKDISPYLSSQTIEEALEGFEKEDFDENPCQILSLSLQRLDLMKDEKERAIQEKSKVKEKIFEERAKDLEDMNALALLLDELDRDLPAALGTLKTLITLAGRFIDTGNGQSSDPDDFEKILEKLKERRKKLSKKVEEFQRQDDEIRKEIADETKFLRQYEEELLKREENKEECERVFRGTAIEIEKLQESVSSSMNSLSELEGKQNQITKELEKAEQQKRENEDKRQEINSEISQINNEIAEVNREKGALKSLVLSNVESIENLINEVYDNKESVQSEQNKHKQLQKEKEELIQVREEKLKQYVERQREYYGQYEELIHSLPPLPLV